MSGVGAEEEVCDGMEREGGQVKGQAGASSKDGEVLLGVKKPLEVSERRVDMVFRFNQFVLAAAVAVDGRGQEWKLEN